MLIYFERKTGSWLSLSLSVCAPISLLIVKQLRLRRRVGEFLHLFDFSLTDDVMFFSPMGGRFIVDCLYLKSLLDLAQLMNSITLVVLQPSHIILKVISFGIENFLFRNGSCMVSNCYQLSIKIVKSFLLLAQFTASIAPFNVVLLFMVLTRSY